MMMTVFRTQFNLQTYIYILFLKRKKKDVSTYTSHSMQNPRSANHQAHPRPPSQISISPSGIASSLLVPEPYKLNPKVDSFFRDFDHGDPHDSEKNRHSDPMEALRNEVRPCRRGRH